MAGSRAKKILFADMGADPRRIRLAEELEAAMAPHGAELFGVFYHSRRTTVPYFLIPRIVKPMNDPRFAFMGRMRRGEMPPDVEMAASIEDAATKYRWADLAGRFLLFKQMMHDQFEDMRPDLVLMWHQFNPYHAILAAEAAARGIPVAYGEHGILPGSMCIEPGGQMAESWVARDPAGFAALPVQAADLDRARAMIRHVRDGRINRKAPGERLADHVALPPRGTAGRRPVLFYAGQNDPRAGLLPYGSQAAQQHSPHYRSSFDALEHLAEICGRRGWDLLYKPHPQVAHYERTGNSFDWAANPHVKAVPIKVDILDCIASADICATVVSQAAYMALFNDRPSVVLGRLQLSGSGAVHEIGARSETEAALEAAFDEARQGGLSAARRAAFEGHVARAARYYCSRFDPALDAYLPNGLTEVADLLARQMDPGPAPGDLPVLGCRPDMQSA